MQTYHADPKLKATYVAQMLAHKEADELIQGTYWKNGKGCAIGCLVHENYCATEGVEELLGWPEWLTLLMETLFEGLSNREAKDWPVQLLEAVPVGATEQQLDVVRWKFAVFLLDENAERVRKLDIDDALKAQVLDAIKKSRDVNIHAIKSGGWDNAAATSARSAASAARLGASESAEWSTEWSAESASESAEWSTEWSAESAAASAAASAASAAWSAEAAAEAAESAAYSRYRDEILRLLRELEG